MKNKSTILLLILTLFISSCNNARKKEMAKREQNTAIMLDNLLQTLKGEYPYPHVSDLKIINPTGVFFGDREYDSLNTTYQANNLILLMRGRVGVRDGKDYGIFPVQMEINVKFDHTFQVLKCESNTNLYQILVTKLIIDGEETTDNDDIIRTSNAYLIGHFENRKGQTVIIDPKTKKRAYSPHLNPNS